MRLIVKKQGIKIEYTPEETLIINHAMRRYAEDEGMNITDRTLMQQMLEIEPVEESEEV